jgi:hypothetical protein
VGQRFDRAERVGGDSMADKVETCDMCGQEFAKGEKPIYLDRIDIRQKVPAHELCFLRVAHKSLKEEAEQLSAITAGVLHVFGGSVRIHIDDMRAGLGRGKVTPVREPGGFITVRLGNPPQIMIARQMPPPVKQ